MLPFIIGAAAGAAFVLVFNNKKQIEKQIVKGAVKAKEIASGSLAKAKEFASDAKETLSEKVECLKSKKEQNNQTEEIV